MDYRDLYNREKEVVIHGQTAKFRIVKYIVLFLIFGFVYKFYGSSSTLKLLLILIVLSLCVHFFFRYMSQGWTKSWWLYKKPDSKNPDLL